MKRLALTALSAILVAGWAADARAGILVEYSTNGGATYTTACTAAGLPTSGTNCVSSFTVGGVTVTQQSGQEIQTSTNSLLFSANVSVVNVGAVTQPLTLRITGDQYTSPSAPSTLLSHIGGSVAAGSGANTMAYQSCVFTPTTCAAFLNPSIAAAGSFQADDSILVTSLSNPFSMQELLSLNVGAGTAFNYSASSTLTPVPEPGSMMLFGMGLFATAAVARRRFRK